MGGVGGVGGHVGTAASDDELTGGGTGRGVRATRRRHTKQQLHFMVMSSICGTSSVHAHTRAHAHTSIYVRTLHDAHD